jgi:hypothetical protein
MQDDRAVDEYERAQRRLAANDAMSLYPKSVGPTLPTDPQDGDTHMVTAEHVATLTAHSPGKVSSLTCSCGVSIVGDLLPFAAASRLMLEHLNGGRSDKVMRDLARRAEADGGDGTTSWA